MPLPYPMLWSATASARSTTVDQGGEWAWPNADETVYLKLVDASWLTVGQAVYADDGSHSGALVVVDFEFYESLGFVNFSSPAPTGGTSMADGAAIREIPGAT